MATPLRTPVIEAFFSHGAANRRRSSVHIQLPGTLGHVVAGEHLSGAFGDEFMAGPVKAPAPHAQVMPGFRHGVAHRLRGRPLIKGGLEQTDQRHRWHNLSEEPDANDIRRIMCWGDGIANFHCLEHPLVEAHAAVYPSRHDGFETNGGEVSCSFDVAAVFKLTEAIFNGLCIIGHALKAALVENGHARVRELEQTPLERSRTQIGD